MRPCWAGLAGFVAFPQGILRFFSPRFRTEYIGESDTLERTHTMATATKPLIGINADYRGGKEGPRKEGPAVSFLQAGYYNAVLKSGGIPVIVPLMEEEDDLSRVLDMPDLYSNHRLASL